MTKLEFFLHLLELIGFLLPFYFLVYLFYRYLDLKYFSSLEITALKSENEFLKQENLKVKSPPTSFWNSGDFR